MDRFPEPPARHLRGRQRHTRQGSPATDRLFVGCGCYAVQEVRAEGFPYAAVGDRPLHGIATAVGTNAAGTVLYVATAVPWNPTTGNGATQLEIFNLKHPPQPRYRYNAGISPQPLFDTLRIDSHRNLLYGSDPVGGWIKVLSPTNGGWIASIDVGQYGQPRGMDISADGSTLAVALSNAAQLILIDLDSRHYAGHLYPIASNGPDVPLDVRFGRSGRLYSTGAPASFGYDYLHVFDTASLTELGRSQEFVRADPRLAMSPDKTSLFVMESAFTPRALTRFDISTDVPRMTASASSNNGALVGTRIVVRPDGSRVYTSGSASRGADGHLYTGNAQVWSADLTTQLGTIPDGGPDIAYSGAADRVFIGNIHGVSEAFASAPYTVTHSWPQTGTNGSSGTTGPIAVSADGGTVYVSSDTGIVVIPRGKPGPPTNVTARAGDQQATVSWAPPADTGSTPISGYTITEWRFIEPPVTIVVDGPATSAVITGLTNGRAYQFQVAATNSRGTGDSSEWSNVVFPARPPGVPTDVTATAGDAQATVNWNAPADTGGAPITGYRVTSYIAGTAQQTYELPWTSGSPPYLTITNLTNGQTYTFTVAARNDAFTGAESAPSNPVVPNA
jgi:fibronectin type III domain protein